MSEFIEDFVPENGTVLSLNKHTQIMIFPRQYNGKDIKAIGKNACFQCGVNIVDLSQTVVTLIDDLAFAATPITKFISIQTITTIEINSFMQSTIPYIYIPAATSYISVYAFNQASCLNWIDVDPDNKYYSSVNGFLMDHGKIKIIAAPRNITSEIQMPYHTIIGSWSLCSSMLERYIAPEWS